MSRRRTPIGIAVLVLALVLGLGAADAPRAQSPGRVIYVAAVEMKGGTQQEKEPYPATIPGLAESFVVKRGEVTRVTFAARMPGLYPLICTKHQPSMQGTVVVLPK